MKFLKLTVIITISVFVAGCVADYQPRICSSLDPENYTETFDPFEPLNRKFFAFNESVDKTIAEPVARAYKKLPEGIRDRVRDFTNNLKEPRNFISSALQGKPEESAKVAVRFGMNSTIGFVGLVDVASHTGLEYRNHDFGQMLAQWGVGDGSYVVIPFLGPSNTRDSIGNLIDYTQLNTTKHITGTDLRTGVQVTGAVDTRANLLPFTDIVDQQPDPYIFVRESYRQRRLDQICNP